MKKTAWKSLDWIIRKASPDTLTFLRKVVPFGLKRKLARFVTSQTKIQSDLVVSISGHKFVDIAEPVFIQVRYGGDYEHELSEVTKKLINKGDTVVDIGANFGWYSILMADAVGDQGQVHSYEPNKRIFSIFEQNIAANEYQERISANNCGLGETAGESVLMADEQESAIGYVKITNSATNNDGVQKLGSIEIRQLDQEMASLIGNIAFVKIDVEGFEPFVLRGASKVLASDNPPAMLMEFNLEALERSDTDIDGFITELEQLGDLAMAENGGLVKIDKLARKNANIFIFPTRGQYKRDLSTITYT